MANYKYSTILSKAKSIKSNVAKKYKLGESSKWSYYIAKSIINPKKDIKKISFDTASKSTGDNLSRQATKSQYMDMAKRFVAFVEKNKVLPNYITLSGKKVRVNDYTYMFARILVWYDANKKYPAYANINTKAFTKPLETKNEVYNYFVTVFGKFDNTIDGALSKIAGKGYGYYYDDVYSNKQSIDRMKKGQGVNCTDSCHVFYNIMLQLIALGKYKKVECLHVRCSGGDGHVRLRITKNDGSTFLRDPAAVLSSGSVSYNWCTSGYTLLAVNPSWFTANLNR